MLVPSLSEPAYQKSKDQDTAETAQKRAQWEQFSFDVKALGMVNVTNESHKNPAKHQYVVTLDDVTGDAMACTCSHHVHRNAFYKHMTAVENATDDGYLMRFCQRTAKTMLNWQSATVTASVVSRTVHA
ncbi:hypothetical protein ACFFQF_16385 [Haladaptatus pallidirubidus]|uniref:SWIM-type domain-containing protein n=1 Tax=Haladaptatus pallidirubidus TaxID=1008152 RepID=A0AAV3UR11_9EURY|nr:hypothetical protein [Haladaptatus pallidirubidus]